LLRTRRWLRPREKRQLDVRVNVPVIDNNLPRGWREGGHVDPQFISSLRAHP
jgi:hypothetical protein